MIRYIVRRVLWLIPVMFVVSLVTFTLMHLAPGGPWDREVGARQLPASTVRQLNLKFHLDEPVWKQYLLYMADAVRGNLGPTYQRPSVTVNDRLGDGLPFSARLGIQALILALLVGLPLGIIAALRQNSWVDYLALFFATVGIAATLTTCSLFVLAMLAAWILASRSASA